MTQHKILKLSSSIARCSALCVSIALLLIGFYKLEKKLPIFPSMAHHPQTYVSKHGSGEAEISWLDQNNTHYSCTIIDQSQSMVCGFDILFYKPNMANQEPSVAGGRLSKFKKIDLSNYDGLHIDVEYESEAPKEMKNIILFLRTTTKSLSELTEVNEEKVYTTYIPSYQLNQVINIDFKNFKVADWWASKHNKYITEMNLDLNNLIQIGFITSGVSPIGTHLIKVNRIEAYRYWVSMENAYLIIILIWLSIFLIEFSVRFIYLSYQNNSNKLSLELLQQQYEAVKNESYLDPLTGMYNRRGLRNMVSAIEQSTQSKNLGLLVLDIDFFKHINDTYGHILGDTVLVELASVLKKSIRSSDIIARWGGEEFIVFFECENKDFIKLFGEKLRLAVEDTKISNSDNKKISITISIGMTIARTDEAFSMAFNRADEALYNAKNTGRNKCCFMD